MPSALPSTRELISAVESAERSRADLQEASSSSGGKIREALAGNDALLFALDKLTLDDQLPKDLREKLFAIRGDLAGAGAILDSENKVRRALERAVPARDSRALLEAQTRSDS
jgi:hypothetical protein